MAELVALLVVAAVISRPVAARTVACGQAIGPSTALILVGRLPVLMFLFAVLVGREPLLIVAVKALGTLPAIAFYRFTLGLLREQKAA